jgi:hypothetical protein
MQRIVLLALVALSCSAVAGPNASASRQEPARDRRIFIGTVQHIQRQVRIVGSDGLDVDFTCRANLKASRTGAERCGVTFHQ